MIRLTRVQLILASFCVITLVFFNLCQRREDSEPAIAFRNWLKVENSRPYNEGEIVPVTIRVEGSVNVELKGLDPKSKAEAMRLLDLLDEAKIFNRKFNYTDAYRIYIGQREQLFSVSFNDKELKKSIELKNFLALFVQFAR